MCAKYGALKCADFFLRLGNDEQSLINQLDHVGFCSLYYAILQQDEPMIELLIKNGAKLTVAFKPSEIGMHLCNCVKNNQIDRLRAWDKAGADLDQADYDGRTPILLVNCFFLLLQFFFCIFFYRRSIIILLIVFVIYSTRVILIYHG